MRQTELIELTVLCLLQDGDKILLQNRVKADWHGYALPGGHIEPGESIVDAVVREMQEETGLTVTRPVLAGVKQFPIVGGRYLVFLFRGEEWTGELHSSEEGEVAWVKRSCIPSLPTVDDFEELIEVFTSPLLNEFQYVIKDGQWQVHLH